MHVVLGIGNSWRADDGAGPAVAERLRWLEVYGVTVHALDGEPARIVEAWDGADEAVVIDAAFSPDEPGTIREVTVDRRGSDGPTRRAHGLGLTSAYELGSALGRLPRRLVVFTIAAEDMSQGLGLSPSVADAVAELAPRIAHRLGVDDPSVPL
jgi:hydrogenase maturation protease